MPPDPENGASRFALADLEFDQVRRLLEVRTRTPMGSEQAAALLPSPDAQEVATRLQLLREGLQLAEEGLSLHFPPLAHPRPELRQLQVAGAVIEGAGLRNLAALAVAVHDMVRELAPHRAAVPAITALLEQVGDLAPFARACRGVFAADGGLNDEASPHLRSLRRRIQQCAERVRRKMAAYLEGPDAERYLRDEFVTQRNGRFVLPVRSEKRKAVGGIVHGASASGITLYVEPLAMVELNNDLIRVQEEETAEEARILAELSHLARDLREAFAMATQVVGRLDQLSAAVALATEFDCRPAMLNEEPKIELVAARHLLLAARLAGSGQDVVPATLSLDHGAPVLIISGPNTGGKTVALKTLGLAVLMNQAGLPVPAHRAALPVFRQVLADIGDHQSLDQDLSTFSSHIQALVRMTGDTVQPALVLVDELGTGTDPEEGAALGIAVVEHFRQRGGFVMVTTHHNGLKAYAETTPGVRNASVEFDEDSLRPTYRLLHGVAGRSGGLDIAERLGLAPAIVKHARSLISDTGRLTQQYVARLADLAGAAADHRLQAEEDRRLAAAERQKAEDDRARLQASHAGELAAAVEAARRNLEKAGREVLNRIEQEFGRQRRLKAEEKARSEYSRLARRE